MTNHEPDEDVQRLRDAERELRDVKRQGAKITPILDKLDRYAYENAIAERLVEALERNVRRRRA